MIKAFADASVIYASIISPTGAARELLKRHINDEVQLIVSQYVLGEVEYNLRAKNPESVTAVNLLVDILAFEVVEVDADAIRLAAEYTELKDAPVVAAARASNSHYLLTFDKKHLLGQIQIMERSGGRIITPGDLLQLLRDAE